MSEELQEALEEISMLIIANSGAARSAAFEALQAAKKKDFAQADQLMESAEKSLQTAAPETLADGCKRSSGQRQHSALPCTGSSDGKRISGGSHQGNDPFIQGKIRRGIWKGKCY